MLRKAVSLASSAARGSAMLGQTQTQVRVCLCHSSPAASVQLARAYSSSGATSRQHYQDPSYMVDSEGDTATAAKEIRVMYLSPAVKTEMYTLHNADPVANSPIELAKRFSVREDRVNGILVLQRQRAEFIAELGVLNPEWDTVFKEYTKLWREAQDAREQEKAAWLARGVTCFKCGATHDGGHRGFAAHAASCPGAAPEGEAAQARYNELFHPLGKTKPLRKGQLAPPEKHPGFVPVDDKVVSATASATGRSADETAKIVSRMARHRYAMQQEQQEHERMTLVLQDYLDLGASQGETGVSGRRKSAKEDYYPLLFGDDGEFEDYTQDLVRRIQAETKAEAEVGSGAGPRFLRKAELLAEAAPADAANAAAVPLGQLGRWKWAFRDLSKKGSQPTMMRTRTSGWRQATPLEESLRSWVRNPTAVELELHRERVLQWADPDGDEQRAAQLVLDKTAGRKAALAKPE